MIPRTTLWLIALAFSTVSCFAQQPMPDTGAMHIADVASRFAHPPDDARIMMRWWWFGPAVEHDELARELRSMKAGGIGGVEIQPVYPQLLDDASSGFRNTPYLSTGFLDAVHFANETARAEGMRVDITLGSGWPYGGPEVTVDHAAGRLRVEAIDVPAGATSVAVPSLEHGETLLAAFAGRGTAKLYEPEDLRPFTANSLRADLPGGSGERVAVFFISSRTGQQVKRAALGAEGFVLDHYDRQAIDEHLAKVATPLLAAFGKQPPFAVFSDSLEVYASDWTPNFLAEFKRRRGYDLTPHLPMLVAGKSEEAAQLRHDWGLTLTELANENYLAPLNDWAREHGTRFRSQNYGEPPVSLSSNRLVDLPEGEGTQWDRFSFTRWATSASHLYGRPITSAETWTWVDSPAFRATPLDMKAEADRFFLEGVNQLVGHGWPYSPPGLAEPGLQFYAAGALNDHNPWWIVMPDLAAYLQRMSYLLRQGAPANDVAVLVPEDDAYARFRPGKVSLTDEMPHFITPELTQAIEASGHNFDYIDAEAIERKGIPYSVLVLPHVERLSPAALDAITAFAAKGGKVIAIGSEPHLAPGFLDAASTLEAVASRAKTLFAMRGVQFIGADLDLQTALTAAAAPDLKIATLLRELGFVHRRLLDSDLYFVVNTSNRPVDTTAQFKSQHRSVALWSAVNGASSQLAGSTVELHLAPYESRVYVLSDAPTPTPTSTTQAQTKAVADLSHNWTLTFDGIPNSAHELPSLTSWTQDAAMRFYSGTATYHRTLELTEPPKHGAKLLLDFGEGTPITADPKIQSGMRALLDPPVREAAIVTINGKRAGSLWCPPYRLDVTPFLRAGDNTIDVRVANTAINELAGRAPADFHLLWLRYGQRAVNQNVDHYEPLPSGLFGPIRLLEEK